MCPTPFPGIFLKNQGKCPEILELYRGFSICAAQFIALFITKKKIFSSVGDSALSRTALHELFYFNKLQYTLTTVNRVELPHGNTDFRSHQRAL